MGDRYKDDGARVALTEVTDAMQWYSEALGVKFEVSMDLCESKHTGVLQRWVVGAFGTQQRLQAAATASGFYWPNEKHRTLAGALLAAVHQAASNFEESLDGLKKETGAKRR